MAFPTDFLSRKVDIPNKPVTWIDVEGSGTAIYIEIGFTKESEETIVDSFKRTPERRLLGYSHPPTGEAMLVFSTAGT